MEGLFNQYGPAGPPRINSAGFPRRPYPIYSNHHISPPPLTSYISTYLTPLCIPFIYYTTSHHTIVSSLVITRYYIARERLIIVAGEKKKGAEIGYT